MISVVARGAHNSLLTLFELVNFAFGVLLAVPFCLDILQSVRKKNSVV